MEQLRPNVITIHKTKFLRVWRWTVVAPNGEIIGASTQGYNDKRDVIHNLAQLFPSSIMQNHHVIYNTQDQAAVLAEIEKIYGLRY